MEHQYKLGALGMLLFLDLSGIAPYDNYKTVVCLQDVSPKDSRNVVDSSSACGPSKQAGLPDYSISGSGIHLQDPITGKVSGTSMRIALRANTTIGFKVAPANPRTGDEIEVGNGFISELSSTYNYNTATAFTFTIQPYGESVITVFEGS